MRNRKANILVVDDDRAVCASLNLLLSRSGFNVECIYLPTLIEEKLVESSFDLILLDMNFRIETTGKKGLAALKLIKSLSPKIPVILMTGWATVTLAVEGMKLGASDFIAKPWDNKELLESIKSILTITANTEVTNDFDLSHIIGEDPKIQSIMQTVKRIANTKVSVLIQGESGTGKELIAEAIHHCSDRMENPFVKVNLGGLTKSLFESELFGYKKGAFTDATTDRKGRFESADGGTVFLDEIGELELDSQVKMLRVLQESTFEPLGSSTSIKVDVRIVSATNQSLEDMVADKSFREDLFYRINLVTIVIPPLRDRKGDIPLLTDHFLEIFKKAYQKPDLDIDSKAVNWLTQQSFKGNIRQLKNVMEKSVIFAEGKTLTIDDVSSHYSDLKKGDKVILPEVGSISLEDLEKSMILRALDKYDNKVAEAAKALGLTRSSLYRRIEKFGL